MIKSVWVKNYRSIADIRVNLEPITILVGHNGSGKSNFVDVFRFVYDACRLGLDAAVVNRHGMSALRRWSAKGRPFDVEIGLTIETDAIIATYIITLGSERRGEYSVKREHCYIKEIANQQDVSYETSNGSWVQHPRDIQPQINDRALLLPLIATIEPYKKLYDYLTAFAFYNIFPNALSDPQKPANPYPLDEHGANLASTLREMQRSKNPLLARLRESINTVLPDIDDIQVSQVGGYLVTKLRHDMTNDGRALFELSQESDGTLRMLGILVALHQGEQRSLVTLEEPELTIHPGALSALWDEIEAAGDRSQVILTTHSPDLLDMCKVEQLRVVEKMDDECPKEQASELTKRLRTMESLPFSVAVVCAKREYEAWFLASLETIHIGELYESEPEEIRNAKGWLRRKFGYKPTVHQANYTRLLDITIAHDRSRSFRRLYHAFQEIIAATDNGETIITPTADLKEQT